MIALYAITNSVTYNLSDAINFGWLDYDAFGLPPIQNITEQGPMQHGVTWLDFRMGPRLVPFTLDVQATGVASQYAARASLLDIFAPGMPIKLQLQYDTGNVRQLDCYINGGLSFGRAQEQGFQMVIPVELIAPDPCWYDPTPGYIGFSLGGGLDSYAVPMVVPHVVGASTIVTNQTLNYPGNWLSYPTITITGPITSPVITNSSTSEKLDFTGTTIAAGHYYTIDTRYSYKLVTDDAGTNQNAKLTTDSNLATFHIERRLAGETTHANSIKVTGTAANAASRVDISYYNRYTGA